MLHGGRLKVPSSLNTRVEEYITKFRSAQNRLDVQRTQPPEEFKLNFDVAVFSNLGRTDFSAII